jgi:hypothetical protein
MNPPMPLQVENKSLSQERGESKSSNNKSKKILKDCKVLLEGLIEKSKDKI